MPQNGSNYIPREIGELLIWADNFVTYVVANVLLLPPLTPAIVAALQTVFNVMENAVADNAGAQAAAQAAAEQQTEAIAAFETVARDIAQQLQASPAVTDPQREAMGLPVYDDILTPVAAPTTRPVVEIDISDRNRHIIHFRDEATPDRKAKPPGVRECELWHATSETEPASANDYLYLAGDSATPYMAEYDNADAGKTVWYLLRWKSTRGETGPWSFPLSAKIPG